MTQGEQALTTASWSQKSTNLDVYPIRYVPEIKLIRTDTLQLILANRPRSDTCWYIWKSSQSEMKHEGKSLAAAVITDEHKQPASRQTDVF